jgi:hypothetical protein
VFRTGSGARLERARRASGDAQKVWSKSGEQRDIDVVEKDARQAATQILKARDRKSIHLSPPPPHFVVIDTKKRKNLISTRLRARSRDASSRTSQRRHTRHSRRAPLHNSWSSFASKPLNCATRCSLFCIVLIVWSLTM